MQFMLDVISIRSTSPLYGKVSRGIHKFCQRYLPLYTTCIRHHQKTTLFGQ